ncbi:M20 family metallopeptidase [Paenibacillaceae bacterium WGS1546]|uniref:M20 family metallopeptidase n=1 Tax=Cohnella sp. WGS1546 TaxID=3366810 RepID=UPI00372D3D9B
MTIEGEWNGAFKAEEYLELLRALVRIDSQNPPGNELGAAEFVYRTFKENGIDVSFSWPAPDRPNVKAVLKGSRGEGRTMIYNGHLDVVPVGAGWTKPPFGAVIEDGKLYGRGSADMKSGVAAMIYAALVLKRTGSPFAGELILYFNVDEEFSNLGIKHFLEEDISADFAVIGEPTDLDACVGHKGVSRYRVQTRGRAGHTAVVRDPDNSIYKMVKLVAALEKLAGRVKRTKHPLLGESSLTVAQFNGGTAPNIVPAHSVVEVDRRLMPGETAESSFGEFMDALTEVAEAENFEFEAEQYQHLPPYMIEEDHELVLAALEAVYAVTGKRKVAKPFEASAEASFFGVGKGIPTLIIGPGSLRQAHTADECVVVEEAVDAARIYVALAIKLLG